MPSKKLRRYRVSGSTYYLGMPRTITLSARNKPEAIKLAGQQFKVDKKSCKVLR